jgi:hypothetical protein
MAESIIPLQRTVEDINRIEATIDDYALDGRRFNEKPLREEYERTYGEQGVGWDVIERSPRSLEEKLLQNMGARILDLIVTEEGTRNSQLRTAGNKKPLE